jgi:hypothetical protein
MLLDFFSQAKIAPFAHLLEVLALGPGVVQHAFALLAFMCIVSYLLRTVLLIEAPLNRWAHMAACVLTMSPAFVLAAVLWWAALRHPERAWLNLGVAVGLYVTWWAGGAVTRLSRADTEGGDIGWLTMGALVTFPVGVIAALIYR